VSIALSPLAHAANINPVPVKIQMAATGTYSNAPPLDITNTVIWSSSNTAIAAVSASGLVTYGGTPGTATITATLGAVTQSTTLSYSAMFIPTSAANLFAWFRTDLGITLNGSNTAEIADQGGGGHNAVQSTPSSQPPYTAAVGATLSYIEFDAATAEALVCPSITLSQPFEYFLVFDTVGAISATGYLIDFGVNDNNIFQPASTTELQLYPGPTTGNLAVGTHYTDAQMNGASTSFTVDNGSPLTGTVSATPTLISIGNIGLPSPSQSCNNRLREIIVLSALASPSDRAAIIAYIQNYYYALL
jgi:Bacterial Ig-like domain (group 2)